MTMTDEQRRAYQWLDEFPHKIFVAFLVAAMLFSILAVVMFSLIVPARMESVFQRVLPGEVASGFIGVWKLGAYTLSFFASFIFIGTAVTLIRVLRAAKLLIRAIEPDV